MADLQRSNSASSNASSVIQLPQDTLAILNEFLANKQQEDDTTAVDTQNLEHNKYVSLFGEDFQLSQFWYTQETAQQLAQGVSDISKSYEKPRCCFMACPTGYASFTALNPGHVDAKDVYLLDCDTRFARLASHNPDSFVQYDLYAMQDLPQELYGTFDVLVVDPPFLSVESQSKMAAAIKLLLRPSAAKPKLVILTGTKMIPDLQDIYGSGELGQLLGGQIRQSKFEVKHESLKNPFGCFVSWNDGDGVFAAV